MEQLDTELVKGIFVKLKDIMDEQRDYLLELDGVMGDGDLGITMQKAFSAAMHESDGYEGNKPAELLKKVGFKIATAAPSTMGTLLATGFMKGSKSISDLQTLSIHDLSNFFRGFTEAIMQAGKTKPGNKTVVDSLDAASTALEKASINGDSLIIGIEKAYLAAKDGVENTKKMKAQHGRAAYYQEKSMGVIDPGSVVGMLIVSAFYQVILKKG